ncbi:Nif3-like dinuclear metal center hexameric protein [Colwellia sp. MB3u-70]|uniref:Nif3-like dinuclear metal center hexameric protein n=1 Tax=unclassified Colwellia TaxID=196834 RepID=UPI0015F37A92|nr:MULTISPECIES: Nif3-like dinuclear metal center hexameric protein [unclassified Colwellia]MBA6293882.1 Nif3-like dinuclear metal center hexameric protein [Colwellia sp. MB3u-8]MBA6306830.1 Nif3-like dinuclear metal center hexameric protein [Colwellia sp. MB3u-70]
MQLHEFESYLNNLLKPEQIKDFCPNGLQIQGRDKISKVITGVTATQALIEQAIAEKADALVVHHGFFWKNESYVIRGMKHKRIKALLANDISLFAYHLPLDIHPSLGNNAQLATLFSINNVAPLEEGNALSVAVRGDFTSELSPQALEQRINEKLNRTCLHIAPPSNKAIKTVAWCSGGGQGYIELAAEHGIDAFISGEVSEQTTHVAREMDIHFYCAGHHATERYGAKALAEHFNQHLPLEAKFIDIDNPA